MQQKNDSKSLSSSRALSTRHPGWLDEPHGPTDASSSRPSPGRWVGVWGSCHVPGTRSGSSGLLPNPLPPPQHTHRLLPSPRSPIEPVCIDRSINYGKEMLKIGQLRANKESPHPRAAGGQPSQEAKDGDNSPSSGGTAQRCQYGTARRGKGARLARLPPFLRSFCPPLTQKRPSGLSGRPISVSFLCNFTHSAFPGRAEGTFDSAAS